MSKFVYSKGHRKRKFIKELSSNFFPDKKNKLFSKTFLHSMWSSTHQTCTLQCTYTVAKLGGPPLLSIKKVYTLKNTRCLCIFTIQRNIFHAISSLIWIITCGFGRSTNVGSISKLEWFLWITSTELLHSLAHKSLYCKNSFKRHRMKSVTIVKRTIWTMPINSLRIKNHVEVVFLISFWWGKFV